MLLAPDHRLFKYIAVEPVTADQLRVFISIVEAGSFSGAARSLGRAQSAVSYAIANLERLLELELFDRSSRKPRLTPAGQAILGDARAVTERLDRLSARACQLREGIEAQLTLAVDMLFPMDELLESLAEFRIEHPDVPIHLRTEALGSVVALVCEGKAQFGISGPLEPFPREIEARPFWRVPMVPVASSEHPLAQWTEAIPSSELRQHLQLVLSDRSELTAGRNFGVISDRTWHLADLTAKQACLRAGFGWGNMPEPMVREDLDAGRLVHLELAESPSKVDVQTYVLHRAAEAPGPAGRWLLENLEKRKPGER